MDPEPTVSGHDPAVPDRRRKTSNIDKLVDLAQPMEKAMNKNVFIWYTHSRPYSSLNGAIISGPNAYPTI